MNRNQYLEGLRRKLEKVAPRGIRTDSAPGTTELATEATWPSPSGVAPVAPAAVKAAAATKLQNGDFDDISPSEQLQLEAIVEEEGRPVTFIERDRFESLPDPWTHFNHGVIRGRIEAAIPAIGRVEMPTSSPGSTPVHLGTGFIVGTNLMMTNRHVAEFFVRGVGRNRNRLAFVPGRSTAIDFRRENGFQPSDRSASFAITDFVMVHPYWDMALFRIENNPNVTRPLFLSVEAPEDLGQREVAVVGYPARSRDRSQKAVDLEQKHFGSIFGVKRLAPGEILARDLIESFDHYVSAMTHDSSTLPGNSGSAIVEVDEGTIVGLHFAGITLKANYSVPTFELARDRRVVDAGVQFAGHIPPTDQWENYWKLTETDDERTSVALPVNPLPGLPATRSANSASWTVPLTISVSLAETTIPDSMSLAPLARQQLEASFQVPIIHPNLETRTGYDPTFLELEDNEPVPLPRLTDAGEAAVSRLEDGSSELKYHRFSVVMHKQRRMALFTASNVNWQKADRLIDGRKPTRKELTGIPEGVLEEWELDWRILKEDQLPDLFFTKDGGSFDKGHLVRRDDVAWGDSFDEMQKGNGDTYHTTNCSPQVGKINQASKGEDNWGDLESLIEKETRTERVNIFSGPVLSKFDRIFKGRDENGPARVQIPSRYWKIVVAKTDDGPKAFGFVLEQKLTSVPLEFTVPEDWQVYQKPIAHIEELLFGLVDLTWCKRHDTMEGDTEERPPLPVGSTGIDSVADGPPSIESASNNNPLQTPDDSKHLLALLSRLKEANFGLLRLYFPDAVTRLDRDKSVRHRTRQIIEWAKSDEGPGLDEFQRAAEVIAPKLIGVLTPEERVAVIDQFRNPLRAAASGELTDEEFERFIDELIQKVRNGQYSLGEIRMRLKAALPELREAVIESELIQKVDSCLHFARPSEPRAFQAPLERADAADAMPELDRIPMLIRVSDPSWNPSDITDLTVVSRMGTIVGAQGTAASLTQLSQDARVLSVEASTPQTDKRVVECVHSMPYVHAHTVREAFQFDGVEETGSLAIVGIIDAGIDIFHSAFRRSDGTTRIIAIWDQTCPLGPAPVGFESAGGTVFNSIAIDQILAGGSLPPGGFPRQSNRCHGTHVASIAAGTPIPPAFPGGVAPEAGLLVVITGASQFEANMPDSLGYSLSHMAALEWLDAMAIAQPNSPPLVVNISLGQNSGAHDGTSPLELACDEFTGNARAPGRAIVKSAGNMRDRKSHASVPIAVGSAETLRWQNEPAVPPAQPPRDVRLDAWFPSHARIAFQLKSPMGESTNTVDWNNLDVSHTFHDGNTCRLIYTRLHPDNGLSRLVMEIQNGTSISLNPGAWELDIVLQTASGNIELECWVDAMDRAAVEFLNHADQNRTLSVPGTARSVITVGAIGSTQPIRVGPFSGFGPTRDRREKPEIAAPGVAISAASSLSFNGLRLESGTSMAAPHVTGAIALCFSTCVRRKLPVPNSAQIAQALMNSAQDFSGAHNPGRGFGDLNVTEFLNVFV